MRGVWQRTPVGRRRSASKRLQRLTPNVQLDYFSKVLGLVPIYKRRVADLSESIFRHEDFYVQALTDENEQVVFYSVTTRSERFRPLMWPNKVHPLSHPHPPVARLGEATFEELTLDHIDGVSLFIRGATAPTFYIEDYYFGNPGLYQHYLAGLNECGPMTADTSLMSPLAGPGTHLGTFGRDPDDYEALGDWLQSAAVTAFRALAVPNTYGVTSPNFSPRQHGSRFALGPDPVQMRTL